MKFFRPQFLLPELPPRLNGNSRKTSLKSVRQIFTGQKMKKLFKTSIRTSPPDSKGNNRKTSLKKANFSGLNKIEPKNQYFSTLKIIKKQQVLLAFFEKSTLLLRISPWTEKVIKMTPKNSKIEPEMLPKLIPKRPRKFDAEILRN